MDVNTERKNMNHNESETFSSQRRNIFNKVMLLVTGGIALFGLSHKNTVLVSERDRSRSEDNIHPVVHPDAVSRKEKTGSI